MRTIRLFVSSPGDVELERARIDRVTERLNGEFWPRIHFQTIRWETKFYSSHKTFQEHIVDAAACDIVFGIFWSRLGTELPVQEFRMADGQPYPSGTAYEVLTAIEARRSADHPDVYTFRKTAPAMVPLNDAAARAEADRQWTRLEDFFARWFRAPDGAFLAAYHEFKTTDQFEEHIEKLLRDWLDEKVLAGRTISWPIETRGSPFRGLAPFDAKHAPVFFGRSRKVMRAVDHLKSAARLSLEESGRPGADPPARQLKPFLLIVGPSGSGKSSLMRAGLGPRITAPGVVPEVDHWRVAVMRPGDGASAFDALVQALQVTGKGDDPGGFGRALPEIRPYDDDTRQALPDLFRSGAPSAAGPVTAALDRVADELRQNQGFDRAVRVNLLLMVDQLEDIFAVNVSEEQRSSFANLLSALSATKRVWIAATLRGDLYNRLLKNRAMIALKDAGQTYDLAPPGPDEIAEIIQQSAEAAGLTYETDATANERLDDRLLKDAEGKDILPLLQFTLDRLFAERKSVGDQTYLTYASYRAMGGLDGAINQVAEGAIKDLDETETAALPRLLRSLAEAVREETGSGAGELTVRAVPTAEAVKNDATRKLVNALVDARILLASGAPAEELSDEDAKSRTGAQPASAPSPDDGGLVRIAHQRVFESWQRARTILHGNRDYFRMRSVVEDQRKRWQNGGFRADLLIPDGRPLEEAEFLTARYGDELSDETRRFVAQSAARARRNRKIKRAMQAALVVIAVVATGAGIAARYYGGRAVANYEAARSTVDDLVQSINASLRDLDRISVQTVEDALKTVRPLVEKLESASGGDPNLKRTRAAMLYEFARTFQSTDNPNRALQEAQESLAIRRALAQSPRREAEWEWDYALSLDQVGDIERFRRNYKDAEGLYDEAHAIRERLIGQHPDDAKYLYGRSQSLVRIGDLKIILSDQARQIPREEANEAARIAYDKASAASIEAFKREPDKQDWQRELSWGFQKVGVIRSRQNRFAEALSAQENALCVRRYMALQDDRNTLRRRDIAFSLERVSDAKQGLKDFLGAMDPLFEALAIRRSLSASDAGHTRWARELAETLYRIGNLKKELSDWAGAAGFYLASLQAADQALQRAPDVRQLAGQRTDSQKALDEAIARLRAMPDTIVPAHAALREAAESEESIFTRALASRQSNALACWNELKASLGAPPASRRTADTR